MTNNTTHTSNKILTINDVLSIELGIHTSDRPYVISCIKNGHRDSNPSCRVYPDSDDGAGSLYCFGCGFSASPVSAIKEIKGFENYRDVFNYIKDKYGVVYDSDFQHTSQYELLDIIQFIKYYKEDNKNFIFELEHAIATSNADSNRELHNIIKKLLETGI